MSRRRKISGGMLFITGFILSPLSWWNDLYVNVPLSYLFAWLVSRLYKPAFLTAFIVCYWMTNIAGFIMMHKGTQRVLKKRAGPYTKKDLLMEIAWSLAYTLLVYILVKLNIIRPIEEYL